MYASITDYGALYNDAYREWRGEGTSFDRAVLPPAIAAFCRAHGLARVLDVSGGQGILAQELVARGIAAVTTDYGARPGDSVLPFNLGAHAEDAAASVLRAMGPEGGAWLTTCLDVLEHIDREHLADALQNLAWLTPRLLVVSISTRPSSLDNLLHSTLLPLRAWVLAFKAAGFAFRGLDPFPGASVSRRFPDEDRHRLIRRWQAADIFADAGAPEPRYLVFERVGEPRPFAAVKAAVDRLCDVAHRAEKRRRFTLPEGMNVNLSLQYTQDWSLLRPLLDVLPRHRVRVLLRRNPGMTLDPDLARAIRSFLRRNGVAVLEFEDAAELPWPELRGEALVAATESSIASPHLQGYQLAALARLHGCPTFLLQHGIWPRAFPQQVITFASEHVLTWGGEEERRLHAGRHDWLGAAVPWGALAPGQALPFGSPKLADAQIGPFAPLDARFGHDPARHDRAVLLGTKNLKGIWGLNNLDDRFLERLDALTRRHPRTLFILRPHPVDGADSFLSLREPNVRCLDEVAAALADIAPIRVAPMVDVVATSPSSMIVDAAAAGRPVLVYGTGQPIEFEGVEAQDLDALDAVLSGGDAAPLAAASAAFRARYAEAATPEFYDRFAARLAGPAPAVPDRFVAAAATLSTVAVEARRETARIVREARAVQEESQALLAALAAREEETLALRARLAEYERRRRLAVFIGWDPREREAYAVCEASLRRHASIPLEVRPVKLAALRAAGLYRRATETREGRLWDVASGAPMATEFAIARFFLPLLADREGCDSDWLMFCDGNVLWTADIAALLEECDPGKALMCVKHRHEPTESVKMDGQPPLLDARKNWSSLMLFNRRHPAHARLTLDLLNTAPGQDLHRFCWLEDEEIGALSSDWNWLEGSSPPLGRTPRAIHYTRGGPWMAGREDVAYAREWLAEAASLPLQMSA